MSEAGPIAKRALRSTMRRLPELMARIDWPRARLEVHRERALRETLAHAIRHSEWHRERLGGVDPSTFRLEDVPSLPTMTKADLMGQFDRLSTDPRVTLERCEEHLESGELLMDGDLVVMASGGSSGVRALGVERIFDLAEAWVCGGPRFVVRWAMRSRRIPRFLVPVVLRLGARAGPPPSAGIGAVPGPHASHLLGSLFGGTESAKFSVIDPMERIVAGLNEVQPERLMAYASFLPRLVDEARQGRLRIRPKVVAAMAEPLLPEHEQAVREVWGCMILTAWGATEVTGASASSGFDPGMLLLDDTQIVEPVDRDGNPVPPGTRADKVFVTPLRSRVLPLIRYEITDQLTVLEEPATCGSAFTRISSVEGRLDDEFVYEGGIRVHPHLFRTALGRRRAITEYQVEQTERGAAIRLVLSEGCGDLDRDRLVQELRDHLAGQGVPDAQVRVEVVSAVPRHPQTQKLKRFVPLSASRPAGAPARIDA